MHMKRTTQTILGAGGAIGTELATDLRKYTNSVRLVGRNPKKVHEDDELIPANLLHPQEVDSAVRESGIVYLTAGIAYSAGVWEKSWPAIMRNVLDACKRHGSRLVFFDNVYSYDPAFLSAMTEDCPVNPCSRKGAVRARIAGMLMEEVRLGQLEAMIVRAADFIATRNSMLVEMVYKNFAVGKKALWIGDVDKVHTFTYAPDAARATALLGNDMEAYNQVWHLPTDRSPMTSRHWIELIAREMRVQPRLSIMPPWMMSALGVFVPVLREMKEMTYQFQNDYFFDSGKFTRRYGAGATRPQDAIRQLLENLRSGN